MVDAVIGEVELPARPSGDWRADLASIAWATRATGRHHRWFAQLGIHPVAGPRTMRYGATAMRSLEGLGLDESTEVNILAALNNYVAGFLQREAAWQQLLARTRTTGAQRDTRLSAQATEGTGHDVSAQHLAARANLHGDESFVFGLDCLLDGIAARIAQAHERPQVLQERPAAIPQALGKKTGGANDAGPPR